MDPSQQYEKWWWRKIWKQKCPAKGKNLVWTILENKIPIGDIIQKREFHGSSGCSLCRNQGDTTDHIFVRCPFTSSVWAEATKLNNTICPWQGASFNEALKFWLSPRTPQNLKAFPIIVSWGIWLARNSITLRDEPQFPLQVAVNCLSILDHHKLGDKLGQGTARRVKVEQIDKG